LSHVRGGTAGVLQLGPLRFPCALGRSGSRVRKREGDGASPIGRWPVLGVLFRSDRVRRPRTALPVRDAPRMDGATLPAIVTTTGPCAIPTRQAPSACGGMDGLYDVVVVLGHNQRPRIRAGGSAIFMHVARPGYLPTGGLHCSRAPSIC
jgi:L,D-peptidoglycan transpeptidase YkuD (ErfK/YbiS/YcfS/YnhG family)